MNQIDKILDKCLLSEVVFFQASFLRFADKSEIVKKKITQFFLKNKKKHTFLIPTFSDVYLYRTNKMNYFSKFKKSKNGIFANYLIKSKIGKRSNHPTNSFYFVGKKADIFSSMHDHTSSPFEILLKIGIDKISFINIDYQVVPSLHLSEYLNGISKKNLLKNIIGSYYLKNYKLKWHSLTDIHGCDNGYVKQFNFHRKKNLIKMITIKKSKVFFGKLNDLIIKDIDLLKKNNSFFLCKNKDCTFCNITVLKNRSLLSIFQKLPSIIKLLYQILFQNKKLRNF